MTFLRSALLACSFTCFVSAANAEDYTVAKVENLPDGLSAEVTKSLATPGHRITGPDGPLCSLWFVKSPAVKESFSPTLSVKYPLTPGGFVGVLRVEEGTEFTDFREQVLPPGLYTLRYGQQPQDGNHIGTSDLADFLMALPAKEDAAPETSDDLDEVVALATEAAGSTHPAILALKPAEDSKPQEAQLVHDPGDDLWMIETAVGEKKPLGLRLVVVGFAFE